MMSPSSVQTRLAAVLPLPGRPLARRRDLAAAGRWIAGIALASLLTSWLTDKTWLAAAVGVVGIVLAAWHWVKMLGALRDALERAEFAHAAMEQSLARSQKMEALGRLTAGVAHDFNNHLTAISSNVELVAHCLDASQERPLRHVGAAIQGVRRAAALTARLLSYSRDGAPEPEPLDVHQLLGGLSDLLRRTLGDRIRLDLVLSREPWFTRADVARMEHALLSLAVNAADQVRGGQKLVISLSNVRLDEAFASAYPAVLPGEYIQIEIGDPTASSRSKSWLPGDNLNSADLAMAGAFVREAGGFLHRLDPAAGAFSARLFLPRFVPPALVAAVSRRQSGREPTILVVEDDADVRRSCVEILRELNYNALEAPDAMEAFRLIADRGGIDLLFTDLGLPGGVSGRDLADAARNLDAEMRVLFTTGYAPTDLPDRVAATLLRKPFSPAQLADKVREIFASERSVARPEPMGGGGFLERPAEQETAVPEPPFNIPVTAISAAVPPGP